MRALAVTVAAAVTLAAAGAFADPRLTLFLYPTADMAPAAYDQALAFTHGDRYKTNRQVISTTDLPPMSSHRFEIPFNAAGKKWVRFAAWDSAGNGAMAQPVKLAPPAAAAGR